MTVGGISVFSKITTKGMSLWIKKEGKRGKFLTLKKAFMLFDLCCAYQPDWKFTL